MQRTANTGRRAVALLAAWNGESYIEATLAALAAQTHAPFEVLISDDASTDATVSICERWVARDARFRLVRQSRRLGWVGNSNALLGAARGDYFFFAGHDDLFAPEYVARLVDGLERFPPAVLAFSDGEKLRAGSLPEEWSFTEPEFPPHRFDTAIAIARQRPNWPVCGRGVFRARAAERVGGMRRNLAGEFGADWPWLLGMALLGQFVRVPERLFAKRMHPDSLVTTWRFRARDWLAATSSCMGEVHRAALPLRDETRFHAELCRTYGRLALAVYRHRMVRNPLVARARSRLAPRR